MAQYDLYRGADGYHYVDVQADTLDSLNTRVVIPLMRPEVAPLPGRQLNPRLLVKGEEMLLVTQYMTSTRRAYLGKPVGSLVHESDRIGLALDMIFHGF